MSKKKLSDRDIEAALTYEEYLQILIVVLVVTAPTQKINPTLKKVQMLYEKNRYSFDR